MTASIENSTISNTSVPRGGPNAPEGAGSWAAFDRALSLVERAPEHFTGHIDSAWNVVRGPNGGYLAALLLGAITRAAADPGRRPRVLTAHFVSVPSPGPVDIHTRVMRRGRSLTWASADLMQAGKLCVTARVALSVDWPSIEFEQGAPPDATLARATPLPPELMPPFCAHYDYRSLYATPFEPGQGDAIGGYIRLRDPRPHDPALLAAFGDAWFPATFAFDRTPVMGATLDYTVHFRNYAALSRLAPEDFVVSVFRSRRALEGFFEEDGELWSPDGQLLAQTRQLALAAPFGV